MPLGEKSAGGAMRGPMHKRWVFILTFMVGMAGLSQAQAPIDERQAQAACQDDAFRLCNATIPDRDRTLACLIQAKDSLSGACRTVLASFFPPDPPSKKKTGAAAQRVKRSGGPVDLNAATNR
jgi:hypothetical protein